MQKIMNYIANGQGLGLRLLIIFSTITAILLGITFRLNGTDLIPYAQSVADQLLPIKVVNGQVVEPAETYKAAYINFGEDENTNLPLVVDTRTDTLDSNTLKEGAYLTRTNFYVVQRNQVRLNKLEGSFELPRADYSEAFKSFLNWTALFAVVIGVLFCFIFYFLLSIFYAFCLSAVAKLAHRYMDFDMRMRTAVISLLSTYVIFWVLSMLGGGKSLLLFFVMVMAFGSLLISRLPLNIHNEKKSKL